MKIDLIPGVIPYISQVRPLNLDQMENLQDKIDEWLEQGVTEPPISPWHVTIVAHEEERQTDEVGYRSKRIE